MFFCCVACGEPEGKTVLVSSQDALSGDLLDVHGVCADGEVSLADITWNAAAPEHQTSAEDALPTVALGEIEALQQKAASADGAAGAPGETDPPQLTDEDPPMCADVAGEDEEVAKTRNEMAKSMLRLNSFELVDSEQVVRQTSPVGVDAVRQTSPVRVDGPALTRPTLTRSGSRTADALRSATSKVQRATRKLAFMYSMKKSVSQSSSVPAVLRPLLHGYWVCVGTWGLGDFLKAGGISYVQRLAAEKAPWPSWEFTVNGDDVLFVNQTMMGAITEEFCVGGSEYTMTDGRKQQIECRATWEGEGEASKLVINRSGPQGKFREERSLDERGKLQFVLCGQAKGMENCSWGRTFERKS